MHFFKDTSNRAFHAFICDQITKIVPDLTDKKCTILDFGCGTGQLTNFIHNAFFNAVVCGVDSDGKSIQQALQEYKDVNFIILQQVLPFENNTFDIIYAVNVFHHIESDEQLFYADELTRVLKIGGICIIFEINPYNIFSYTRFINDNTEKGNRLISAQSLKSLFLPKSDKFITHYYFLSPVFAYLFAHVGRYIPVGSIYSLLLTKK